MNQIQTDGCGDEGPVQSSMDSLSTRAYSTIHLLAFGCLLILIPALICFFFIRSNGINVPYMDEWTVLPYVQQFYSGKLDLVAFLNVQDSEHKCFVPFALWLLVVGVTKYNDIALMYCIYTVVALSCALLIALGWPLVRGRKNALLILSPIAWIVFSIRSWENLLWGMQLTITMCVLLVILTVYLLSRSRRIDLNFVGAALAALGATYCMANGVTAWVLGLLQISLQRFVCFGVPIEKVEHRKWWQMLAAWMVLSVAAVMGYATHLNLHVHEQNYSGSLTLAVLRHDVLRVVRFFLACFGSPLAIEPSTAIAMACVLLAVFATALFSLLRTPVDKRKQAVAPIVLFTFAVCTVVLVTIGRFGGGLDSALHSRYCTFTNLGVAGLYLLLLALGPAKTSFDSLRTGILIGIISVGTLATWQYGILCGDDLRTSRVILANAVRYHNLQSDDTLIRYADVGAPDLVRNGINYLERHDMSVFADVQPPQLAGLLRTNSAPCFLLDTINSAPSHAYPLQKHVVIDTKTQPTLEFRGWAIDFGSRKPCSAVFVNIDNKLDIPVAMGIPYRELVSRFRRQEFLYSGFGGTCRSDLPGVGVHTVTLKIISPDLKSYYQSGPLAVMSKGIRPVLNKEVRPVPDRFRCEGT